MDYYKEERPWGSFTNLYDGKDCKVKILDVNPGQRLSYQSHQKREENWVVVTGEATVILDDKQLTLKKGEHIFVAKRSKHRLWNKGKEPLRLIETQTGEYFGEDDIKRFEDDYNRVN